MLPPAQTAQTAQQIAQQPAPRGGPPLMVLPPSITSDGSGPEEVIATEPTQPASAGKVTGFSFVTATGSASHAEAPARPEPVRPSKRPEPRAAETLSVRCGKRRVVVHLGAARDGDVELGFW